MKKPRASATQTDTAHGPTSPGLFAALRDLLLPYKDHLVVVHDDDAHFYANGMHAAANGKAQFFAAVKMSGSRCAFHFMPVYDFPELLVAISPLLKKHMHGKSCFNMTVNDPVLLDELRLLVAQGVHRYRAAGKL